MKQPFYLTTGIILAVIIMLIFFGNRGWLNPVEDLLIIILKPIQTNIFSSSNSINNYLTRSENIQTLNENIQKLTNENLKLIKEKSELLTQLNDLKIVREEKEFLEKQNFNYRPARVIGRTSDNIINEIIINVGTRDGIKNGFAVIAESGYLIGKVVACGDQISKVLLITDRQSEIAAEVQNDTGAPGIVVGQLGLSLKMTLLPQNEVIQRDQGIITSGLEANIPKGIIIGQISSISLNPGDIFQQAIVNSIIQFNHLNIVSVIIPYTFIND